MSFARKVTPSEVQGLQYRRGRVEICGGKQARGDFLAGCWGGSTALKC